MIIHPFVTAASKCNSSALSCGSETIYYRSDYILSFHKCQMKYLVLMHGKELYMNISWFFAELVDIILDILLAPFRLLESIVYKLF